MKFPAPLKSDSIKIMLLGSGELGKEVIIEAQRLGIETIAVDSYNNAPAQLVANKSYTINMKNKNEILDVIRREKPTYILPEVEAINIQALFEAEKEGYDPDVVVCHLDKISYGNDDNVIPYDFLKSKGISVVISGHEHKPYHFTEGNMQVIGTGSLLPYSHAEDPEGKNYITFRNFDDVKDFIDEYPEGLKDMHVRVYIEDERMDEFLALDLDTVSLQVNKLEQLDVDEGVTEVVTESYDAKTIWSQSVAETGLYKEQAELLWADIEAKGIENE